MKIPRTNLGEAALLLVSSLISLSYQADSHIARDDDPCSIAAAAFEKTQGSFPSFSRYWNFHANIRLIGLDIPANIAHDCLEAIPLHKDDALYTVQQLRLFLQFYSAQTYFAKPPTPELELTPVDLNKTLDDIEASIKSGAYANNYAYDKAVHNLFGYYRDGHVVYDSACYMPFVYQHKYPLVSVAKTAEDLPEIHALDIFGGGYSVGDRVVKINNLEPSDYLATMANTHPELIWVDPDARYNQLLVGKMNGEVLRGVFASRSTYDDDKDDDITLTWENGTTTKIEWTAQLRSEISVGAFDSVDSFYEKICLRSNDTIAGLYQEYNNPELSENSNGPSPTDGSQVGKKRNILPFIAPDAVQPVRRAESSSNSAVATKAVYGMEWGELELYSLTDDIGVLVLNTFTPLGNQSDTGFIPLFSQKVAGAISYLREKSCTKIIIDVSGNGGGYIRLGRDAVRQFFPGEATFFATNMRWNPALATMLLEGTGTNSTYWDLDQYRKASDDSAFTSYNEFLGPVGRDGDSFTVIAVDDSVEVEKEDPEPLPTSYSGPQPFDTGNIVLVSSWGENPPNSRLGIRVLTLNSCHRECVGVLAQYSLKHLRIMV